MNIFIDTAVKGCNIALFDNHVLMAHVQEPIERGHAETLLPMIQDLINSIHKTPQDIENIFVTIGPGSFTGLRVCLTTAQFMAYAMSISARGISTFQAFSSHILDAAPRMVLVETKREDYFVQMMDANHQSIGNASNIGAAEIIKMLSDYPDVIITGDAAGRFFTETQWDKNKIIHQDMINAESVVKAIQSNVVSFHKAEAFYIRDADVTMPK